MTARLHPLQGAGVVGGLVQMWLPELGDGSSDTMRMCISEAWELGFPNSAPSGLCGWRSPHEM